MMNELAIKWATVFKSATTSTTGNCCGRGEQGNSRIRMLALTAHEPTEFQKSNKGKNMKHKGGNKMILATVI